MAGPVTYQKPGTTDLVLDSESIGTDQNLGVPLVREFVVPQESISGQSVLGELLTVMMECLDELRRIRILTASDKVMIDPMMLEGADEELE